MLSFDRGAIPLVVASILAGAVTWGSSYFQQRAVQCESQVTANEHRIVNTNVNLMATYQRSVDRKLSALAAYMQGLRDPGFIQDLEQFDRDIRSQVGEFELLLKEQEARLLVECDRYNLTSAIYALLALLVTGIATYLGFLAGSKRAQRKRAQAVKKSTPDARPKNG